MTSSQPDRRSAQGFTLIEIVVSLFIVLLIMGISTLSFDTVVTESRLEKAATALKLTARKAMRESVEKRRSYQIILMPTYLTVGRQLTEQEMVTGIADRPAGSRTDFEDGIVLRVKRWTDSGWRPPVENGDVWRFEPSGITEPLSVRLDYDDSYIEMQFNPLTAHVEEDGVTMVIN